MNTQPLSFPTTSDISKFMRDLGYYWSNQAQVYYHDIPCKCLPTHRTPQTIDNVTATHMYRCLIGDKPYKKLKTNPPQDGIRS
jgi:hypothetical protein